MNERTVPLSLSGTTVPSTGIPLQPKQLFVTDRNQFEQTRSNTSSLEVSATMSGHGQSCSGSAVRRKNHKIENLEKEDTQLLIGGCRLFRGRVRVNLDLFRTQNKVSTQRILVGNLPIRTGILAKTQNRKSGIGGADTVDRRLWII